MFSSSSCALLVGFLLSLLTIVNGHIFACAQNQTVEEFFYISASFGNDLPPGGLRGLLIKADPPNGCSAIAKPPNIKNFTGKWLALITRNNCSFEVKVRNAQAAGYDCAIVHNVDSDELESMAARNLEGIVIPSLFVSSFTGFILADHYLYTMGYDIKVEKNFPYKNKNKKSLLTHFVLRWPWSVILYPPINHCQ